MSKKNSGFTLIELLVVIGILGILLAIVLIAINPAKQFAAANNTKRNSDVVAILNSIHQYAVDKKGALPGGIPVSDDPADAKLIDSTGADICSVLSPTYIALIPADPGTNNGIATDCTGAYVTGYKVRADTKGRLTVSAPDTDTRYGSPVISVTR